jgi:hypothetical protein
MSGQLHNPTALFSGKGKGAWVSPRADLETAEKRKISIPCRESKTNSSVVQSVACLYTDLATQVHY